MSDKDVPKKHKQAGIEVIKMQLLDMNLCK